MAAAARWGRRPLCVRPIGGWAGETTFGDARNAVLHISCGADEAEADAAAPICFSRLRPRCPGYFRYENIRPSPHPTYGKDGNKSGHVRFEITP